MLAVRGAGCSQCSLGSLLASVRRCALLAEPLIVAATPSSRAPSSVRELARDRGHHGQARFAFRLERVPTAMQPAGARVGLSPHGEGLAFASALQSDAPTRSAALMPGGFDQKPARM